MIRILRNRLINSFHLSERFLLSCSKRFYVTYIPCRFKFLLQTLKLLVKNSRFISSLRILERRRLLLILSGQRISDTSTALVCILDGLAMSVGTLPLDTKQDSRPETYRPAPKTEDKFCQKQNFLSRIICLIYETFTATEYIP